MWFADEDAASMSAFWSDIDQDVNEGDFLFTMMFAYGTSGGSATPTLTEFTEELSTVAPASPRFAYAYYNPSAPDPGVTPFGIAWEWTPDPVSAANINVAIHRSGLDYWTIDWWSDGPASSVLVSGYEIHLGMLVFVWSDTGTSVVNATLMERSSVLDGVGVMEAWMLEGVPTGSSTVDIDVTALSGDVQWVSWVDLFEL